MLGESLIQRVTTVPADLPQSFHMAKLMAVVASVGTPCMVLAAIVRGPAKPLLFSFVACIFVPVFATLGYAMCAFMWRSVADAERSGGNSRNPMTWMVMFPFNLLKHEKLTVVHIKISRVFLQGFVLLWCGFLVVWVAIGTVLIFVSPAEPVTVQPAQ